MREDPLLILSLFKELFFMSLSAEDCFAKFKLDLLIKLWASEPIEMLRLDAQLAKPGTEPLALESMCLLFMFFEIDPDWVSDL